MDISDIIEETLPIFRSYPTGKSEGTTWRIDALTMFVVNHGGEAYDRIELHEALPAPQLGDSTHYPQFIEDVGLLLLGRFGYPLGR